MWDNHGILYTLFNSIILKIFKPEVGVPALILERYANLALLVIGFYILHEMFYLLSSKFYFASFGAWFFSLSSLSTKAIEIRPDNLQCLFLYASLFALVKSFNIGSSQLSFWAGILISLMLMTNLKSLIVFGAIIVALAISRQKKDLVRVTLGAGFGLTCAGIILNGFGILDDYLKYNWFFNLLTVNKYANPNNIDLISNFLLEDHYLISFLLLVIVNFLLFNKKSYSNPPLTIILSIIGFAVFNRIGVYVYRLQYDLIYFPLACFLASYIFFITFKSRKIFILAIVIILGLMTFATYEKFSFTESLKSNHQEYLTVSQKRFLDINRYLNKNEYLDYYTVDNCPGFGFRKDSEHLFFKYRNSMLSLEELEQKEIFGASYIDRLESKKVRVIIGTPEGIRQNPHLIAQDYIFKNYKYYNCIWERVTPFTKLR